MKKPLSFFFFLILSTNIPLAVSAQKFKHPGIHQTQGDLEYMKKQVLKGEEPWKAAFDRLKASTDLNFIVKPHTHVLRGSYGKPNIGGDDLSKGSSLAYNCALLWFLTDDKAYANKAIEIINAWSSVLWDFDYNDAKLLAGWTGHQLCNAAEILRYTQSGWQQKDIDTFSSMLMKVYYPLMRFYYPQANGNWDGAIIHSILSIAVFTDNQEMFENGLNHFKYGPMNASIFKYIYPSGQCQESTRDQAHVQLGLGEFAGAAQVAYTQGVDLFSIGDNRIALGFEYTAKFLMGEKPHCYGVISERAKALRDDFEYVYRHYTSKGIAMPYTKAAADSVRPSASRSVLTAFRAPTNKLIQKAGTPKPSKIAFPAGALEKAVVSAPKDAVKVLPGQSIQDALDNHAGTGKWILLSAGIHTLPAALRFPSGLTLAGEGLATVLFIDPASGVREAIVNADTDLHDVTIRDLVIEAAVKTQPGTDPNSSRSYRSNANRGGIMFLGLKEGEMNNINLINITVQNATYNGVFISGAENLKILNCDFNENGSSVVPGPKLQHNLLLTHCSSVEVMDSRLDTSPHGSGIALNDCKDVLITHNEIARNAYYGIFISESTNISVSGCLIEGNDRSGVMAEYLYRGSENISVTNNNIQFNNGYGFESYSGKNVRAEKNTMGENNSKEAQQKISTEKYIIMQ